MTATTTPAAAPATAGPAPSSSSAPTMGRLRTADGLELASYRWPAGDGTTPPRATIALVHG
ncbi:alpha/beta hydrolase, partial [Burkholderia sp. Ac-20392]|nr:alpha/beta hydrolase [Burkholderia sp. Ac-20392]